MKIAFFSSKPYDELFFRKENEKYNFELNFFDTNLSYHVVNALEDEIAICVFVNDIVDRNVIKILAKKGVKIIALRCAGFNNVDLEAAKEYGIKVCRVPAYSPEAVAEHTLAMLLTLNRKTHKAYNRVREQNFSLNGLLGFNIHKKTVGVIGTGKIGKAFIDLMKGFDCKILAYDLYPDEDLENSGVNYVGLDTLFKESDIISLHCPLTPENKYLINKTTIAIMKDGVTIINTSRGGLINTIDAIEALKEHKIGYLGIDVYEQEEKLFFQDLSAEIIQDDTIQRLMSFPNVLVTAHQAFFTQEALEQISEITLRSISDITTKGKTEEIVML
ncbi:2-hydroxyacid dehydrogenase [Chishuiella sp.]|uniref:2-hydroxyacid dehydrogenase n=1 Tax=Chishuiella sp. TaxID=1969467 RepID=UPI0028A5E8A2|nr:2-hydroxyacid dehydrogenase [Chishuiella sp.]